MRFILQLLCLACKFHNNSFRVNFDYISVVFWSTALVVWFHYKETTQQNANDNVQAPRQAQTGAPVQIQTQSPAQYPVQYPNVQSVV